MELAISTCYDYKIPIARSIEHIGRAGFRLVSLGGRADHSRYMKDRERASLIDAFSRAGLTVDSIHAPFDPMADLTEPEPVLRHSAIVEAKRCIIACRELNASTVILHLNFPKPAGISERLRNARESVSQILDFARTQGVRIAAENLPDDNSLIILKYALDMFEDKAFGLCFDSGHAALHRDAFALLDRYRDRVYALHLHDNDGKSDLHQLPFEGVNDLPNLAAQLNKGVLTCPITVESETAFSSHKAAEAFLARALESGNKFKAMLKT